MTSSNKKLQFVEFNNPILDSQCRPLGIDEIKEPEIQQLIDEMFAFARGEQKDQQRNVLVGLAAPQIGRNLCIILVDIKADGKGGVSDLRLYINPELVASSEEREDWYEACYSTGNVKGIVSRPKQITIKALDRMRNEIEEIHFGYVARIFQHEIDHLNGIRFPDRSYDTKVLHLVKPEEMHDYRNKGEWKNWPVILPKSNWKQYM
jgi:peptide deformylase